jgi:hypothetical protein
LFVAVDGLRDYSATTRTSSSSHRAAIHTSSGQPARPKPVTPVAPSLSVNEIRAGPSRSLLQIWCGGNLTILPVSAYT